MATWTSSGWCPPGEGRAEFYWRIDFLCRGEEWSPQSVLLGGPPDGVDLAGLLRAWFERRGGPDACWRLQVTERADETAVVAEVELHLSGWVQPQPIRLDKPRHPGPSFQRSSRLLPPLDPHPR